MIRLHPHPDPFHDCPTCGIKLTVKGWLIPGMRTLADLICDQCGEEYYGDLLAGHSLYTPSLLNKESGAAFNLYRTGWLARRMHDSYAQRTSQEIPFTVESFRPLKKVLLLDCLDVQYGHLLWKLLNAQYYLDHHPEYDLVVMVPRFMRWLVPDGAAEIWTVDMTLRGGGEWNDWLADEIHRRLDGFDEVMLSVAYSVPHRDYYSIERFTRVAPFNMQEWQSPPQQPVVTFIWRDDRRWEGASSMRLTSRLQRGIMRRLPKRIPIALQRAKVIRLAELLRRQLSGLTFAVVGTAEPTGLPAWIQDMRTTKMDTDTETDWCRQYAQSHVVIGVHGSNMLLPSAHAATTINLLPEDRLVNSAQDLMITESDGRMGVLRYRIIPLSTPITEVASLVRVTIEAFNTFRLHSAPENVAHDPTTFARLPLARRIRTTPDVISG